jgi:hypothetical protein
MRNSLLTSLTGLALSIVIGSLLTGCTPGYEPSPVLSTPVGEEQVLAQPAADQSTTTLPGTAHDGPDTSQGQLSGMQQAQGLATPETLSLSAGQTITVEIVSSEPAPGGERSMPGEVPSGSAGDETPVPVESEAIEWFVYSDSKYGFTINYPSVYVIMPQRAPQSFQPQPIAEVLFQDKDIAESDVAVFAPPAFAIRIFDNSVKLPVAQWLTTHQLVSPEGVQRLESYVVDGTRGARNCLLQDIVPNCMIYVPFGGYLYEFIPNGDYADAMLDSFRFGS